MECCRLHARRRGTCFRRIAPASFANCRTLDEIFLMSETDRAVDLAPHRLSLALLQPQIAPNTGNIARLCVATGTHLHLVRPLGFVLSDQKLKRSAMDYWPRLKLTVHDDTGSFFLAAGGSRRWLFSTT